MSLDDAVHAASIYVLELVETTRTVDEAADDEHNGPDGAPAPPECPPTCRGSGDAQPWSDHRVRRAQLRRSPRVIESCCWAVL